MKHDPFDVLEEQLRQTVRRRRVGRLHGRLGLFLAVLVVGGAGAGGAAALLSHDDGARDRAIAAGLTAAGNSPACKPSGRPRGRPPVHGVVDPRVARQFGIFRRPQSSVEAHAQPGIPALSAGVILESRRRAYASNGAFFELQIVQGPLGIGSTDAVACVMAQRNAAIAAATDNSVRDDVRRVMDGRVAAVERNAAPTAQSLTYVAHSRFNRSAAGGAARIRDGKIPAVYGLRGGQGRTTLFGLVPDPVHTIQVVDQSGFPRERSVTTRAHDNVYDITLPRRMGPRMLVRWQRADGTTILTLHPHR